MAIPLALRACLLAAPLLALALPFPTVAAAAGAPTCGPSVCVDGSLSLVGHECVVDVPSGREDCWVLVEVMVHAESATPGVLVFDVHAPGHFRLRDACPYTTGSCTLWMTPTVELRDVDGRCETLTATLRVLGATAADAQHATWTATRTFCY